MSKFRIVMDMDFAELAPEVLLDGDTDTEAVRGAFQNMVIAGARQNAMRELHSVRRDQDMDMDVKAIRMAEQLRKIMSTMMAEANLSVQPLAADTPISTKLPFEERYDDAVIHRQAA